MLNDLLRARHQLARKHRQSACAQRGAVPGVIEPHENDPCYGVFECSTSGTIPDAQSPVHREVSEGTTTLKHKRDGRGRLSFRARYARPHRANELDSSWIPDFGLDGTVRPSVSCGLRFASVRSMPGCGRYWHIIDLMLLRGLDQLVSALSTYVAGRGHHG